MVMYSQAIFSNSEVNETKKIFALTLPSEIYSYQFAISISPSAITVSNYPSSLKRKHGLWIAMCVNSSL